MGLASEAQSAGLGAQAEEGPALPPGLVRWQRQSRWWRLSQGTQDEAKKNEAAVAWRPAPAKAAAAAVPAQVRGHTSLS